MALHYRFDLLIQAVYGIFGFVLSQAILYLVLGQVNLLSSLIIGVGNFLVAGFYTEYVRHP